MVNNGNNGVKIRWTAIFLTIMSIIGASMAMNWKFDFAQSEELHRVHSESKDRVSSIEKCYLPKTDYMADKVRMEENFNKRLDRIEEKIDRLISRDHRTKK